MSTRPRCGNSSALRARRGSASRRRGAGPRARPRWLSSPFDEAAVDMLAAPRVRRLKIASGDLTHHRLIARAARDRQAADPVDRADELDEVRRGGGLRPRRRRRSARAAALRLRLSRRRTISRTCAPSGRWRPSSACRSACPITAGDAAGVAAAVALGACLYERHIKASETTAIDAAVSSTPGAGARSSRDRARDAGAMGDGPRTPQAGRTAEPAGQPSRSLCARAICRPAPSISRADVIALRPAAASGEPLARADRRAATRPSPPSIRSRRRSRRRRTRADGASRSRGRLMRLNVLITAAPAASASSAASSGAARPGLSGG